jgi:hypothetical protein
MDPKTGVLLPNNCPVESENNAERDGITISILISVRTNGPKKKIKLSLMLTESIQLNI